MNQIPINDAPPVRRHTSSQVAALFALPALLLASPAPASDDITVWNASAWIEEETFTTIGCARGEDADGNPVDCFPIRFATDDGPFDVGDGSGCTVTPHPTETSSCRLGGVNDVLIWPTRTWSPAGEGIAIGVIETESDTIGIVMDDNI